MSTTILIYRNDKVKNGALTLFGMWNKQGLIVKFYQVINKTIFMLVGSTMQVIQK